MYYYKYTDIQTFISPPNGLSNLQNAGAGRLYGLKLEAEADPWTGLTLHAGIGLEHARYARFDPATVYLPSPSGGNYTINTNAAGFHVYRTPQLTGNVGVTYSYDLGDNGALAFNASTSYTGAYYWDFINRFRNSPYALVNMSAKYTTADNRRSLTLWGKNITSETYFVYLNPQQRYTAVAYGDPATYGVTLGFNFDQS